MRVQISPPARISYRTRRVLNDLDDHDKVFDKYLFVDGISDNDGFVNVCSRKKIFSHSKNVTADSDSCSSWCSSFSLVNSFSSLSDECEIVT